METDCWQKMPIHVAMHEHKNLAFMLSIVSLILSLEQSIYTYSASVQQKQTFNYNFTKNEVFFLRSISIKKFLQVPNLYVHI